jgi:hypothetical protein
MVGKTAPWETSIAPGVSLQGRPEPAQHGIRPRTPQAPGASSDPSPAGGHEIPVTMATFGE